MVGINRYIRLYKKQLENGEVQKAYRYLLKYVMRLKSHFSNQHADRFSFGAVSPGYMDFTYFPFSNEFLQIRKLRFGIVLNHQAMRFEIWLMGQNAQVQRQYWEILKNSQWNAGQAEMPKYSVLESILTEYPDFDNETALTLKIEKQAVPIINEVIEYIKNHES